MVSINGNPLPLGIGRFKTLSIIITIVAIFFVNSTVFAASGVSLFSSEGCMACHTINGQGGSVGPNLSHVGSRRSLSWIKTQITDPSAHFASGSMVAINGKSFMAIMPKKRYISLHNLNVLAAYLESLGGKKITVPNTGKEKKFFEYDRRLVSEFKSETAGIKSDYADTNTSTWLNVYHLENETSRYISFLQKFIKKIHDTGWIPAAKQDLSHAINDRNRLFNKQREIANWCNQTAMEYPGVDMPLQLMERWNYVCRQ